MGPSSNGRRRLLLLAAAGLAAVDSVAASSSSGTGPDYLSLRNLKQFVAIVMAALVMAFFLLGLFSICLHRCAGPPPPLGGPDDDDDEYPGPVGMIARRAASRSRSRTSRRTRGLDRAVLDSFPTMAYADAKAHRSATGKGALECAVCLSEFDDDETLRLLLPRCAHAFHADCIDAWLASHVTCPVCRAVLTPASASTEHEDHVVVVPPAPPRQPELETSITSPEKAVSVIVVDAGETEEQRIRREEAAELMRIGSVKRALRSKSGRRPAQFPRSHTTGHSLAARSPSPSPSPSTSADSERYTLRLPDDVLREVVAAGNLRRSASVQTTRRGFGIGIARAGRSVRLGSSGRWPSMSVLARTFSARLPAWGSVRRGAADATAKGAKFAGGDGKAVEQCGGGACTLGAHV